MYESTQEEPATSTRVQRSAALAPNLNPKHTFEQGQDYYCWTLDC